MTYIFLLEWSLEIRHSSTSQRRDAKLHNEQEQHIELRAIGSLTAAWQQREKSPTKNSGISQAGSSDCAANNLSPLRCWHREGRSGPSPSCLGDWLSSRCLHWTDGVKFTQRGTYGRNHAKTPTLQSESTQGSCSNNEATFEDVRPQSYPLLEFGQVTLNSPELS